MFLLPHRRSGFSMLELSIVLVILSILMAGAVTLGNTSSRQSEIAGTYDAMQEIDGALHAFLNEYGRLPCPASITLTRTDALYGREATDCADASPPAGLTRVEYPAASGNYVRIGGLPFYSLQIPESYLGDRWRNRYLYAVNESAITALDTSDEGTITILDDSGSAITNAAVWVVVSHGRGHKGAYSDRTGALLIACDGGNKDGENCDNDGVFTDAAYNDGDVAANFFDDLILWKTRMRAYSALAISSDAFVPWMQGQTGDLSGYPLEIKGVTTVTYNGGQGYSVYSNRCHADFPDSWLLRTSDLAYIEDLPVISGRIHVDTCDHMEEGDKQCHLTFSKTAGPDIKTFMAGVDSYNTATKLNCSDWTDATASGYSLYLSRTLATENFRRILNSDTAGLNFTHSACNTTQAYICVGEK